MSASTACRVSDRAGVYLWPERRYPLGITKARRTPETETLNWTRGLFRLWVLLSVLWIVGVTALAWSDPWRVTAYGRAPTAEEVKGCNEKTPGPWCKDWFVWEPTVQERAFHLRWYGAAAFGVPFVVLLLGVSGRWVLAGFKSQRPS